MLGLDNYSDKVSSLYYKTFGTDFVGDGGDYYEELEKDLKLINIEIDKEKKLNAVKRQQNALSVVGNHEEIRQHHFSADKWKKVFCILTVIGLFVFENNDWVHPEIMKINDVSNYLVDFTPISSKKLKSILSGNGLFVNKIEPHAFEIYNANKREIYYCHNLREIDYWVDSINVVSAFEHCNLELKTVPNSLIPIKRMDMVERLAKWEKSKSAKEFFLKEIEATLKFTGTCVPLSKKTYEELILYLKQLKVKHGWCFYEVCRNQVYIDIIKSVCHIFGYDLVDLEKQVKNRLHTKLVNSSIGTLTKETADTGTHEEDNENKIEIDEKNNILHGTNIK
ncbi:uncharacterized protein SCODWIG_00910 [Saccharomycodes ludwigii]|uniref:PH domain-containing protein n=2 Tax=Saccharomycodes ludwigii TaxID=36035 RepID=A0A376B3I3_9ASCO|nr:uncharacterized protein SCODWIG_00910 [Saccharomycodes ludwigii]